MHHWLVAVSTAALMPTAGAQPALDPAAFAAEIERPLSRARYMEGRCERVELPDWAGLETMRCAYEVTDERTGARKNGLVLMLNPSAMKLSRWIVNACIHVRPRAPVRTCARRVFSQVLGQSGGQFPIAGVVYEDLIPRDGIQEAYGFRQGVTVLLAGLKHCDTRPLAPEQLQAASEAEVTSTASQGAPARIIGVTRMQYLQAHPGADVSGLNWLSIVAAEHQAAMRGDRNRLIEAWLQAAP